MPRRNVPAHIEGPGQLEGRHLVPPDPCGGGQRGRQDPHAGGQGPRRYPHGGLALRNAAPFLGHPALSVGVDLHSPVGVAALDDQLERFGHEGVLLSGNVRRGRVVFSVVVVAAAAAAVLVVVVAAAVGRPALVECVDDLLANLVGCPQVGGPCQIGRQQARVQDHGRRIHGNFLADLGGQLLHHRHRQLFVRDVVGDFEYGQHPIGQSQDVRCGYGIDQ